MQNSGKNFDFPGKNFFWGSQMKFITMIFLIVFIAQCNSSAVSSDKVISTEVDIELFSIYLENFRKDIGRYPSQQEGLDALFFRRVDIKNWNGPYINKRIPLDPWGNKYRYVYPSKYGNKNYDIYSIGKNRIDNFGNVDDITNWKETDFSYYYKGVFGVKAKYFAFFLVPAAIAIAFVFLFLLKWKKRRRLK